MTVRPINISNHCKAKDFQEQDHTQILILDVDAAVDKILKEAGVKIE